MKVSVAESGSVIIHSFYCAMQEAEINLFNYTSMLSDTTEMAARHRRLYLQWRSLAGRCGWFWGSQRPRPSEAEGGWPASAPVLRGRVQSVMSLPTQSPPMLVGPNGAAWKKASWETSRQEEEKARRRDWDWNARGGGRRNRVLGKRNGSERKLRCRRTEERTVDGEAGDEDSFGKERRRLSLGRLTICAHSMANDVTLVRHSMHSLAKTRV